MKIRYCTKCNRYFPETFFDKQSKDRLKTFCRIHRWKNKAILDLIQEFDIDIVILICKKCDNEVHQQAGCTLQELSIVGKEDKC